MPRIAIALVALGLVGISAQPVSGAHNRDFRGKKIDLFNSETMTIPASNPSYIYQGWCFPITDYKGETGWHKLSRKERAERRNDKVWRIEVFVNGDKIALDRSFHKERTQGIMAMCKRQVKQFAGNHFEPGTYNFVGRWYGDVDDDDKSELEVTRRRTVKYTS